MKLAAATLPNHLMLPRTDPPLGHSLLRLVVHQVACRCTRMDLLGSNSPLLALRVERSQQAAAKPGQHPLVAQLIRMPRCFPYRVNWVLFCVRNEGPADGTVLNTSADVLVSPLQL